MSRRAATRRYEVVGPICESGDFLGHDRELSLNEGDLLAIMSAGAYAMTMSSNYNTRPRAAEVMISGSEIHLIRETRKRCAIIRAGTFVAVNSDKNCRNFIASSIFFAPNDV